MVQQICMVQQIVSQSSASVKGNILKEKSLWQFVISNLSYSLDALSITLFHLRNMTTYF